MAEYLIQGETLDNIANAINAKTGGSSAMTPAEMVTAIGSISGGSDITPYFAVAGEVTPLADSQSLAFPIDGKTDSANKVLYFIAYVDDYTQYFDQNDMVVGCYKALNKYFIPSGKEELYITVQTIDTVKTPPLNYWASTTSGRVTGNNYVVSGNYLFKAGVKYNYIVLGVGA